MRKEGKVVGDVLFDDEQDYSRLKRSDNHTIIAAGSGEVDIGAVLGKITDTGEYTPCDPDADDGSEVAVAVNLKAVDATEEAVETNAVFRKAIVLKGGLEFVDGATEAQKETMMAQLEAAGIVTQEEV